MKLKKFELEMLADVIILTVKDRTCDFDEMKDNLFKLLTDEFHIEIIDDDDEY